jgi:hypothetical protein
MTLKQAEARAPLKIVESKPASSTEDAACERCGIFDALEFAGKILCADCVHWRVARVQGMALMTRLEAVGVLA